MKLEVFLKKASVTVCGITIYLTAFAASCSLVIPDFYNVPTAVSLGALTLLTLILFVKNGVNFKTEVNSVLTTTTTSTALTAEGFDDDFYADYFDERI